MQLPASGPRRCGPGCWHRGADRLPGQLTERPRESGQEAATAYSLLSLLSPDPQCSHVLCDPHLPQMVHLLGVDRAHTTKMKGAFLGSLCGALGSQNPECKAASWNRSLDSASWQLLSLSTRRGGEGGGFHGHGLPWFV